MESWNEILMFPFKIWVFFDPVSDMTSIYWLVVLQLFDFPYPRDDDPGP